MFSLHIKTYRFFSNKLMWIEIIIVLSVISLIFYLALFLYRDFYETIVQA